MTIPKIIHQIWWQGKEKIPSKYLSYIESWKTNHPDFKYMFWDEKKVNKLIENKPEYIKLLSKTTHFIQKIDIAKCIILYYYGGIYTDMDTISEKPLDDIIENSNNKEIILSLYTHSFVIYKHTLINNGIIFSKKHSNFLNELMKSMNSSLDYQYFDNDTNVLLTTGPFMFTYFYNRYSNKKDILLLEHDILEGNDIYGNGKGKYVTHIHELSWSKGWIKKVPQLTKVGVIIIIFIILFLIYRYKSLIL